jgi:hypothetical protein
MILKPITTIDAGYPFRGKIPEVVGSGVVAVQMKDVSLNEGIRWSNCIETELSGKRKPNWLKPGDILFIARGSNNYAVLVTPSLPPPSQGEEFTPSPGKGRAGVGSCRRAVAAPHFFVLHCQSANLLPEYLVWQLNQAPCQRYFQREAEGTLTKSIRRSVLEATPIVVPPLAKQRSIVQLANSLKQQRQLMEQLIRNNEILMRAIAEDLQENNQ